MKTPFRALVDEAELYDNDNGFVKVAEYRNGELRTVGSHWPMWLIELQAFLNAIDEKM